MTFYKFERYGKNLHIIQDKYDPLYEQKSESLFTQTNGYVGVRGASGLPSYAVKREMLVAGMFNRAYPEEVVELVNCPDVTQFHVCIDGRELTPDSNLLISYKRDFSVHTGELFISQTFELNDGREIRIDEKRFADYYEPHLFLQKVVVHALKGDFNRITFISETDGQQTNCGVSHFIKDEYRVFDKSIVYYRGLLPKFTLHMLSGFMWGRTKEEFPVFALKRRKIIARHTFSIRQDESWQFEKYTYILHLTNSNELDAFIENDANTKVTMDCLEKMKKTVNSAMENGYDARLLKHKKAIEPMWKQAGISIDGASREVQTTVDFATYHLLGMMPWNRYDCSVAAKGLTGEGYKGHVFWDTEMFILPFFAYEFPEQARNMLLFRYNGLDEARKKAKSMGFAGALYPWEAALDGSEETPRFAQLNIYTGTANPIWSGLKEHHVTADIGFAVANYTSISGDEDFLKKYGYEMIFDISDFWVSRAEWDDNRQAYVIRDIIGPDEYTEHIDNDAYTNFLAWYCVKEALKCLDDAAKKAPWLFRDRTIESCRKKWSEFADKVWIQRPGNDGIIPQDDTFLKKKGLKNILLYKNAPERQKILEDYSRPEIVDMQVLKQADVVQLLDLFPHFYNEDIVRKNVLYYEAHTVHDSSLSYCAHAQACATTDQMELANKFFKKSIQIDLNDNPYDSCDGIHAAAMGGIWDCIVQGYLGISTENGVLVIEPHLPREWRSIHLNLNVFGKPMRIEVSQNIGDVYRRDSHNLYSVEITSSTKKMQRVRICNENYELRNTLTKISAVIFDLDGVLVSTDRFHYQSWKYVANELGVYFDEKINNRLRGVSRKQSLEIILEQYHGAPLTNSQKIALTEKKNSYYKQLLKQMTPESVADEVREMLKELKTRGVKLAIGSSSKNAGYILDLTDLRKYFDAVSDGNNICHSKPDPEVFTIAAEMLNTPFQECLVVDDASVGMIAAKRAGMSAAGIGDSRDNEMADYHLNSILELKKII